MLVITRGYHGLGEAKNIGCNHWGWPLAQVNPQANPSLQLTSLAKAEAQRDREDGDGDDWMMGLMLWLMLMITTYYPLVMTKIAIEAMAIEIVDVPINSMVIFYSYVSLPEGIMN